MSRGGAGGRAGAGAAAALAALLPARPAEAHAFRSGAGLYDQFLEGGGVALGAPSVLLALVALGLALGLWRTDAVPRAWPFLVLGLLLGMTAAPYVGPSVALAAMALAGLTAAAAALAAGRLPPWAGLALAVATGTLAMAVCLEGHGRGEVPWAVVAGMAAVAAVLPVVVAGAVRASLDRARRAWVGIAWRAVASWTAAVAILAGAAGAG